MFKQRNIVVSTASAQHVDEQPVEIVERKGIGHPDSLCDGIAERISVEYSRWCREHFGTLLHHNFDKVQLVAGETEVGYGYGELIQPIRIQIAGRGTPTYQGRQIPMHTIAIEAARAHLRESLRYLDPVRHVVIDSYAGKGASELAHAVDKVTANDTSFGVGHWPHSNLEHIVYQSARHINTELLQQLPLGEDVKVMGARIEDAVTLTVCLPLIATEVHDQAEYLEVRAAAREAIQRFAGGLTKRAVQVDVNTADDTEAGAVYLTLTGTSAEMGDDGSVGRGNRVTGVIAPFRAASLEAAAGKNPISHVGKLYNLLALEAAREIVTVLPEVRAATVYILSQIGKPLDEPLVAHAQLAPQNGTLTRGAEQQVAEILDTQLADITTLRERILRMELCPF